MYDGNFANTCEKLGVRDNDRLIFLMEPVTLIQSLSQWELVQKTQGFLIVLHVFAKWSEVCECLTPSFTRLVEQWERDKDEALTPLFFRMDVDTLPVLCQQLGAQCFPCFIIFSFQRQVDKFEGSDLTKLERRIRKWCRHR
eukprot:c9352_g1_i2.p1 GENE.c9352_g1_i2~~c9352_g1_i2.p1  ORF type:complete len:141 (+),score=9.94 c9352_g1_i2:68-490(+)